MRTVTDDDGVVWELVECFWRPARPDYPFPFYEYTFVGPDGRRRVGTHAQYMATISAGDLQTVLSSARAV
jgi:hypothetical protein